MIEDDCHRPRPRRSTSPVPAFRQVSHDLDLPRAASSSRDGRTADRASRSSGSSSSLAHRVLPRPARATSRGCDDVLAPLGAGARPARPATRCRCDRRARLGHQAASSSRATRPSTTSSWDDSGLGLIDLQYHDIRPEQGPLLQARASPTRSSGSSTEDEVAQGHLRPARDTRAYFRGMCLQKYADEVVVGLAGTR